MYGVIFSANKDIFSNDPPVRAFKNPEKSINENAKKNTAKKEQFVNAYKKDA